MSNGPQIILFDADVLSHFIACGELAQLPLIIEPHEICILDFVYAEISRIPSRRVVLDALLESSSKINLLDFPIEDLEIKKEFAHIKSMKPLIGNGERACMSVALFRKNIIASSNFSDVRHYCGLHNIRLIGTLDILCLAREKGIFSEQRCNKFINQARKVNNARFPSSVVGISDYQAPDLSFI